MTTEFKKMMDTMVTVSPESEFYLRMESSLDEVMAVFKKACDYSALLRVCKALAKHSSPKTRSAGLHLVTQLTRVEYTARVMERAFDKEIKDFLHSIKLDELKSFAVKEAIVAKYSSIFEFVTNGVKHGQKAKFDVIERIMGSVLSDPGVTFPFTDPFKDI